MFFKNPPFYFFKLKFDFRNVTVVVAPRYYYFCSGTKHCGHFFVSPYFGAIFTVFFKSGGDNVGTTAENATSLLFPISLSLFLVSFEVVNAFDKCSVVMIRVDE